MEIGMRKKMMVAMAFMAMLFTGCTTGFMSAESGVFNLGKIGDTEFYSVHAFHLMGPNWTMAATKRDNEEGARIHGLLGSDGLQKSLVGAAGNVLSSYYWGSNYNPDPDTYQDNSTISVQGGNQAQSQGQDQGQNAEGGDATNSNQNSSNSSATNSNNLSNTSNNTLNSTNANNNALNNTNSNANNNANTNTNSAVGQGGNGGQGGAGGVPGGFVPPGQGGTPPGQGGTPPGNAP